MNEGNSNQEKIAKLQKAFDEYEEGKKESDEKIRQTEKDIEEIKKDIEKIKKDKDEIDQRLTKVEVNSTIFDITANYHIKQAADYLENAKAGEEKIEELRKTLNDQWDKIDGMIDGGVSGEIELKSYLVDGGVVVGWLNCFYINACI